jgi:hypothetical protein
MRKMPLVGAILFFGASISLTVAAERAVAQGPAGAGASAAAQDSSHSFNPINWVKKDTKTPADGPELRLSAENKLTPSLQAQGMLAADVTLTAACAPFLALDGCLAALHASHNLGVDFNCLRAGVTGVPSNADMSGCKVANTEKSQGLDRAIRQLKPDADSRQATKVAEQQARDDLKTIGL